MSKSRKRFSRARSISLTEHGSPFRPPPLPLRFLLRSMRRSKTFWASMGRSLVCSFIDGLSERLGEALRRLAVSPFAGRAYRLKSDNFGCHPQHKKDVEAGAGVEPFLTAERPTSKTPDRGEAERLSVDVTTTAHTLTDWASLSTPFSLFRFFNRRWRSSASRTRENNFRIHTDSVRTKRDAEFSATKKPSKSARKSRAYWVREGAPHKKVSW